MSRCYIVFKNSIGCEIACIEVDKRKPIEQELKRVIDDYMVILEEGDVITFESR